MNRFIHAAVAVAALGALTAGCGGGSSTSAGGGSSAPSLHTVDDLVAVLQKAGMCPNPTTPDYTALDDNSPANAKVTKTVECGAGTEDEVTISGFASTQDRDYAVAQEKVDDYQPFAGTGDNLWIMKIEYDHAPPHFQQVLGSDQMTSMKKS